jgi:hypothetical protein
MVVGGISDAAVSRSDGGAAAVKSLFYFFFPPFLFYFISSSRFLNPNFQAKGQTA